MSEVDFFDRYEHAQERHQFKERLAGLLRKRSIELIFVRWVAKDNAWLLTIAYKDNEYTLRAVVDLQRRTPFSVSTIKHLKDRVVFWKDIVDEREANNGAVWR